ncbi:MAG: hypothetical protein WBD22_04560, partial [Pyrinomonadaceae bacterium]
VTVSTNTFGYFSVKDLVVGETYIVSVGHRRYTFANPSVSFTLLDNVVGLTFAAAAESAPKRSQEGAKSQVPILSEELNRRKP